MFHYFAAGSHLRGLQHVRQAAVKEKGGIEEFRNKKVKELAQGKKKKKETAEHKREIRLRKSKKVAGKECSKY